jgi:undecaprenyl-diphosphatase
LGLLQGPTELLPVSSSGHTTLLPWLAGWPYGDLDGELRKSFELALHAGAGLALAIELRGRGRRTAAALDGERAAALALSLLPAALAGAALRGPIERRLGTPRAIAAALAAGALAMALADARPGPRTCVEVRAADGLALGLAQAVALVPGISRLGATLAAARARGFARPDAEQLAWTAALPVILGASLVEVVRLARGRAGSAAGGALALGSVAAFASTLVSARALRAGGRRGGSLLPYSLYRCLLAAVVLSRARRGR